jgi:hypothetical protein
VHKRLIVSALFVLCLLNISSVEASPICSKEPGFIAGPVVPTERAAKEIYIAIARSLFPRTWRKYPIIFVLDEGETWGVGQRNVHIPDKTFKDKNGMEMERVTIQHGGGALEMEISKCDASVKLSFSR